MLIDADTLSIICTQPHPGEEWEAAASVEADLTPAMPYINAVTRKPEYHPDIPAIVWRHEGRRVAVRSHEIAVDEVADNEAAVIEIRRLVAWINDLWERREEIRPAYQPKSYPPLMSVLKQLPMNNCGDCALPTCTAFAAALIDGEKRIEECSALASGDCQSNVETLKDMGLA